MLRSARRRGLFGLPAHGTPARGLRSRTLLVVLSLLLIQLGSLVAPAYACGCGALVHDPSSRLTVNQETSAVRWDGRDEQIVMSLTVAGNAGEAAWIMPVPHRATVTLGDSGLFDALASVAAPVSRTRDHFWPTHGDWPFASDRGADASAARPAPGAPAVGVVGREQLGPFDVARLTATDPKALDSWLRLNGFRLPGGMSADLQPYVDRKWEYVAVRLAPEQKGRTLTGTLDPLRLSFASDRLVYPMRLSRRATNAQSLELYVLAAHRMEPRGAIGGLPPQVTYAGEVAPTGPLGRFADGERYLTAVEQSFPVPSRIDGDHELTRTASDRPFQRVVYEDRLLTVGGVPVWLLTVGAGLVVLVVAALLLVLARHRRPVVPPQPVHVPPPLS
ncbi:DUF2330 domain-containing protein [Streptomyces sp. NBC_01267]|uniref:DUF2330 domain-containing protein n=1 Tax=Streptomyces sp. NBC_01267 TaxID=2903805 RepID=UPI002E36FCC4|nr:DUF2330 domain-containing protein [Streptomyces sp. NBC_01267]